MSNQIQIPKQENYSLKGQIISITSSNKNEGKVDAQGQPKNPFIVTEVFIKQDASFTNPNTGEFIQKDNILKCQFKGKNSNKPESFQKGQIVEMVGKMDGVVYQKADGKRGHFQNFDCFKISAYNMQQPVNQTTHNPVPVAQPVPQTQQNWSNQNTQTTTQVAPPPATQKVFNDDLPF